MTIYKKVLKKFAHLLPAKMLIDAGLEKEAVVNDYWGAVSVLTPEYLCINYPEIALDMHPIYMAEANPEWYMEHRPHKMFYNSSAGRKYILANNIDWVLTHKVNWLALCHPAIMLKHDPVLLAKHNPRWLIRNDFSAYLICKVFFRHD